MSILSEVLKLPPGNPRRFSAGSSQMKWLCEKRGIPMEVCRYDKAQSGHEQPCLFVDNPMKAAFSVR